MRIGEGYGGPPRIHQWDGSPPCEKLMIPGHKERFFMEPLDSDYEYVVYRSDPKTRFNWLYIIPTLGVLWLLYLFAAATFQFSVSSVVDTVMGLMLVIFFVIAGLLFWALAPKENR